MPVECPMLPPSEVHSILLPPDQLFLGMHSALTSTLSRWCWRISKLPQGCATRPTADSTVPKSERLARPLSQYAVHSAPPGDAKARRCRIIYVYGTMALQVLMSNTSRTRFRGWCSRFRCSASQCRSRWPIHYAAPRGPRRTDSSRATRLNYWRRVCPRSIH